MLKLSPASKLVAMALTQLTKDVLVERVVLHDKN